ncbi:MAG TPA: hypothetical protein QF646_02555, partial [Candidatus Poseidoniales archaeon]|nr:hypothetical protein [Candidatus Poseidoniales archaeon]
MNDWVGTEQATALVDLDKLIAEISNWVHDYAEEEGISTLVVGVSGGIDSAVTSTLCAMTGFRTILLNMPIHQDLNQCRLASQHIQWLMTKWI